MGLFNVMMKKLFLHSIIIILISKIKNTESFTFGQSLQNVGCEDANYDILFLIDSSSSVGEPNFKKVLDWIINFADTFELGNDKTRIGIITYADEISYAIKMDHNLLKEEFYSNVRKIPYQKGNTYTGKALAHAAEYGFTAMGGMRDPEYGYPRIAIILTDGRSQDYLSGVRGS